MGECDKFCQTLLTLRLVLEDQECLRTISGEGAVAKMNGRQRLMMKSRTTVEALANPLDAQRFATGMHDDRTFVCVVGRREPSSQLAVDTRGVSLIHHQELVMVARDREQVLKRGKIANHTVETFDHDPDAAHVKTAKLAAYLGQKNAVSDPKNLAASASRLSCSSQLPRRRRAQPAPIGAPGSIARRACAAQFARAR